MSSRESHDEMFNFLDLWNSLKQGYYSLLRWEVVVMTMKLSQFSLKKKKALDHVHQHYLEDGDVVKKIPITKKEKKKKK